MAKRRIQAGFPSTLPGLARAHSLLVFAILLGLLCCTQALNAQDFPVKDQAGTDKKKTGPEKTAGHSISRAAIYSAVLPGLGQAYNRKYWKIPIIYAGFGVIGYFIYNNTKEFKMHKEAYVYTVNGETYPIDNPLVGRYNATQLEDGMDFYRRNRDLSYIIGGLWYVANILEAYVDAHFFDYDISEDLTMKISPAVVRFPETPYEASPGIKVSFKF